MGFATLSFAAAMLVSPLALASTEIPGGAYSPGGFASEAPSLAARDDGMHVLAKLLAQFQPMPATGESLEAGPLAMEERLLSNWGAASPGEGKRDRFSWVIPLIAFAGLTAVFAGKRSGGRGLILN